MVRKIKQMLQVGLEQKREDKRNTTTIFTDGVWDSLDRTPTRLINKLASVCENLSGEKSNLFTRSVKFVEPQRKVYLSNQSTFNYFCIQAVYNVDAGSVEVQELNSKTFFCTLSDGWRNWAEFSFLANKVKSKKNKTNWFILVLIYELHNLH